MYAQNPGSAPERVHTAHGRQVNTSAQTLKYVIFQALTQWRERFEFNAILEPKYVEWSFQSFQVLNREYRNLPQEEIIEGFTRQIPSDQIFIRFASAENYITAVDVFRR